jgi:hypothetical protein
MSIELVGADVIAERLGVPVGTVRTWVTGSRHPLSRPRSRATEPPFPRPVGRISGADAWAWQQVRQWAEDVGLG